MLVGRNRMNRSSRFNAMKLRCTCGHCGGEFNFSLALIGNSNWSAINIGHYCNQNSVQGSHKDKWQSLNAAGHTKCFLSEPDKHCKFILSKTRKYCWQFFTIGIIPNDTCQYFSHVIAPPIDNQIIEAAVLRQQRVASH